MIKRLHTSDWHLGRIIYGRSLLNDQEYFINNFFLPYIKDYKPDAIIIAGDIYDRKIAPSQAIRLFDNTITEICLECNTQLIIISGNHDGADRLTLGSKLLSNMGVHFISRIPETPEPIVINNQNECVNIWPLPYFEPVDMRDYLNNDKLHSFNDSYKSYIKYISDKMPLNQTNILTAHCFVTGSKTSESESPLYIGGSGEVHKDTFSLFDYVALGHLHAPQCINNIYYSGSPLKYSFDEEKHTKCINKIEINNKNISVEKIPVPAQHDMRKIIGKFDELIENAKHDKHNEDYIFAVLLDDVPIFEPVARLREYYPNILGLESSWMYKQSNQNNRDMLRKSIESNKIDDIQIFEQFLSQMCGYESTPEDIQIFNDLTSGDDKNI